ncbi:MAG TPA: DNA polymerase III subunit delta [Polyangiaceae bacterium]
MTPEQAIREAQEQKLRPVYLLVGDEHHLQASVAQALRSAALAGGIAGLNEDQFHAGECDADSVLAAARTLPMMAKRRFVLVRELERWEPKNDDAEGKPSKGKGDALDKILEYTKNPSPSTILVLLGPGLDKRRRLVAGARSDGFLVSCEPLSRGDLPGWIERTARTRGNPLEPGVADLLAELCGPELGAVADALERVCLYAGEGKPVSEDIVSECVVRLRTASVWELVGAIGARDVGAALSALDQVYDPQDRGLRLLGVIAWSTRQLLRFESALREGVSPNEAAVRAGAPPFKARELAEQVRRIPRATLERWLPTLAELDLALKGGSRRPPKALLEHAILNLCSAGSPGRGEGPARNQNAPRGI